MNPAIEPALRQAALTTFGDMCMALPSVEMSADQIEAPFEAEVRVRFHGSVRGEVLVRLYGTVLDSLAQGMRGDNELMPTDLLRDALGEIGNVICGNALPLVAGEHGKYRLDPPRPALANDAPLGGPAVQTKTQVGLDGGRAEVGIYLEETTTQIPHPPLRGTFPQEGKENKGFPSPLGRPVAELPSPGAPEALMRGQGEGTEQLLEESK